MPVIILLVIMVFSRVWPLGTECILRTDMYHQYAPFFSELREKLRHGGSLLYTWDLGLGVNFTAIIAYYLASPLNWLVVLAPERNVIEFMTILILVRTGLCGAGMAFYLQSKDPRNGFGAFLFGMIYALSGYVCAYYWNLMWFDTVALFPLIMLGLERLIRGESGLLYGVTLALAIFSNYYIAIPICMFLVIWFFAYSVLETPGTLRTFFARGIRFALWSLMAGGIAAAVLLPEIYAFTQTASSDNTFPKTFSQYFPVISMLARHMAGVQTEQGLDHWPNIYAGTAVFLLFPLYFLNRRIRVKEKAVYISICVFMLAGFSVNVLNFIWHGFHYPNSLPARQSFIYIFLVLVMGFRVFQCRRSIRRDHLAASFAAAIAFILIAQQTVDDDAIHFAVYYAALLITALYAGLFHLYLAKRAPLSKTALLLFILLFAELSLNTAITSLTTTSRTSYTKDNDDVRSLLGELDDDSFYRVEKYSRKTKNDGAWLHFRSMSIFSSMANADCTKLFKSFGCEASTNAYSITGSTPLIDMLMDVKYVLFGTKQDENPARTLIGEREEAYLYRNRYVLPLGFMSPEGMNGAWIRELDDPALLQNSLCDALSLPHVLIPEAQPGSSADGTYAISLSADGEYYAFLNSTKIKSVTVNWPTRKKTFENLDRRYLIELGDCKKGDLIRFTAEKEKDALPVTVYRFDHAALEAAYDKLSKYPLEISSFGDDYLEGTIRVDTGDLGYPSNRGMIFLSIPYDEGWKVMVDGEPVMIYKGLDALLSFYLSDGEHKISMRYVPRGLKAGMLISVFSMICMILAVILGRRTGRVSVEPEAFGTDASADIHESDLQASPVENRASGFQSIPADIPDRDSPLTAGSDGQTAAETEDIQAESEEKQALQAEKGDENL